MLLQPTTQKLPSNYHHQNHTHLQFSSSLSFSSGLLQNSSVFVKQSTSYKSPKNPLFITCSKISQVHSYGTVDYEKRPVLKWNALFKKIKAMEDSNLGVATVLNQMENGGKRLSKWELCRVVKELRKFRRYKSALEVYDWMNNRAERFRITTSDTAIQLDLIAKVHGILNAEQYFMKLPDALKDMRIYGSLLNVYVRARMREKAESLMDKMRDKNYTVYSLPFNVMMTLYMNLRDQEKIESLITEMKEKNIPLDIYTYNIWLSSRAYQGSVEKMEQVFQQMQLDPTVDPTCTTFCTMAAIYIKQAQIEKAEDCLREIEKRITARDRMPYHYLISLYGSAGNKEEVYRVWNSYKANFINIPNWGYHIMISALIRIDDIEGAEKIYDEWLVVKSSYDPRVANLLLSSYVRKELSQKAGIFFNQMIEGGGKPNSTTWEILSEDHIRNMKIPEAISCFQNAASAEGSKNWRPRPANISAILKICEQEGDLASKNALLEVLRQLGLINDAGYLTYIPLSEGGSNAGIGMMVDDRGDRDGDNDGDYVLLNQFQESL